MNTIRGTRAKHLIKKGVASRVRTGTRTMYRAINNSIEMTTAAGSSPGVGAPDSQLCAAVRRTEDHRNPSYVRHSPNGIMKEGK